MVEIIRYILLVLAIIAAVILLIARINSGDRKDKEKKEEKGYFQPQFFSFFLIVVTFIGLIVSSILVLNFFGIEFSVKKWTPTDIWFVLFWLFILGMILTKFISGESINMEPIKHSWLLLAIIAGILLALSAIAPKYSTLQGIEKAIIAKKKNKQKTYFVPGNYSYDYIEKRTGTYKIKLSAGEMTDWIKIPPGHYYDIWSPTADNWEIWFWDGEKYTFNGRKKFIRFPNKKSVIFKIAVKKVEGGGKKVIILKVWRIN